MKSLNVLVLLLVVACSAKNEDVKSVNMKEDDSTSRAIIDTSYLHQTWQYKKDGMDFELDVLEIIGDSVIAQYCADAYNGERLDCEPELEPNVRGKIIEDTVYVDFYSFYGAKNGHAKVFFKKDNLVWVIDVWPTDYDCFAPREAVMSGIRSKPAVQTK